MFSVKPAHHIPISPFSYALVQGFASALSAPDGARHLLAVWDFASGSMIHGAEVYAPASGQRDCTEPETSAQVLAKAKETATSLGLDLGAGLERHRIHEDRIEGTKLTVVGRQVKNGEKQVAELPDQAQLHSAWSKDQTLVLVVLLPGELGQQARLLPPFGW